MKVTGPGSTPNTKKTDKKDKKGAGGADSSFGDMVSGQAEESGSAGASQSIAKVDSLRAVQAVEDPTARAAKKRMRDRGENILQELDKIRMALLTGEVTVGDVISVADVVASHREKIMDTQLTAILDEIDLRAQVELAKIRMATERMAAQDAL